MASISATTRRTQGSSPDCRGAQEIARIRAQLDVLTEMVKQIAAAVGQPQPPGTEALRHPSSRTVTEAIRDATPDHR